MDLTKLTIEEAHKKLTEKEITVRELVDAYLSNIKEKNENLNIYLTVFDDEYIEEQVKKAQEKIDSGEATKLTGIPISIKDIICIKNQRATGGSKILENYKATYDATVIEKLKEENVIFLGKTNTDEFAQGVSTENSAYGVTKNPHDETRVAGGTSGGASASIASNTALIGLGTDTGGSIREPAAYCGVVGFKPTYGSVSRYGAMPMASSFDVISPIAKTVSDTEILFNAIKGKDKMDSTSHDDVDEEIKEVKTIGVPTSFLKDGMDEDAKKVFDENIESLKKAGYEIKDIEIPMLDKALAVYYILTPAEVSSNLAKYDGVKYGKVIKGKNLEDTYKKTRGQLLGPEVKRRIMLGTYVLSAGYSDQFYRKAWYVRGEIRKGLKEVFKEVDAIAMPVATGPAFKIGEKVDDPLQMYLVDIFTVVANVAGIPALAIPGGTVEREEKDLPVGIQFLGNHGKDRTLFELGKNFETIR